jgi:GNAT superfamily N-acetyltransferase
MAALSRTPGVRVRAAAPGEGAALAALWRELWEAHETWGGYPGSRDRRVYVDLAARLDEDAKVRAGQPLLGRHLHLVADLGGVVCGQVEGWVDRHGIDAATPFTCEVRSLVVARSARHRGVGRALLDAVAREAVQATRGERCVLAAEVLAANPASEFYDHLGYLPVAWNARIDVSTGAALPSGGLSARLAARRDDRAVAYLELVLAARRQSCGDRRYDRPRSIDPAMIGAIALQLESGGEATQREPTTLVAADAAGIVCGVTTFAAHALDPPFVPGFRALAGRFAVTDGASARPALFALVGLACRLAGAHGATSVELTDLSAPATDLHQAALAAGAHPWSRVVMQPARD